MPLKIKSPEREAHFYRKFTKAEEDENSFSMTPEAKNKPFAAECAESPENLFWNFFLVVM
jgi:hypothetical protein